MICGKDKNQRCSELSRHLSTFCFKHDKFSCPDILFSQSISIENNASLIILIKDGGSSGVKINFCPFCGGKLN